MHHDASCVCREGEFVHVRKLTTNDSRELLMRRWRASHTSTACVMFRQTLKVHHLQFSGEEASLAFVVSCFRCDSAHIRLSVFRFIKLFMFLSSQLFWGAFEIFGGWFEVEEINLNFYVVKFTRDKQEFAPKAPPFHCIDDERERGGEFRKFIFIYLREKKASLGK